MKVKPSLFLNMSPQTTENGALSFARNMKLDDDGNLVSDYGYKNITSLANYNIIGHIVGLDNKIYFFTSDSRIIEYDENTEQANIIGTSWTYSGGEIDGYVNTNISGEKILTIAEFVSGNNSVPIKHINLSYPDVYDESLYCQAPKVPIANLLITDTYPKAIPNGVYVFFIRYRIRKDVYTNWFLCSNPIFAGTSESIVTLQGGVKYINTHKDAAKSFVLDLNFINGGLNQNFYEGFQLGFIITHDEATDARIWKNFDMPSFSSTKIYFDYDNVEEGNIDDLLETTYELYNVRNVTSFKNKLYISNYKETNFNNTEELESLANNTSVRLAHVDGGSGGSITQGVYYNDNLMLFNSETGYYDGVNAHGDIRSLFLNNHDLLNISVTSLAKKGDIDEREDVMNFYIRWDSSYDPDVAGIYQMNNNIQNSQVFGSNFDLPFNTANSQGWLGVVVRAYDDGVWLLTSAETKHPWEDRGFSFIYGSLLPTDRFPGAVGSVMPFNSSTKTRYLLNIGPGWVSRNVSMGDGRQNSIRENIENEIKGKSRFICGYVYIVSGTNIYNIGYINGFENDNYVGFDSDHYWDIEGAGNINYGDVKATAINKIYSAVASNIVGIGANGIPVLSLTNSVTGNQDIVSVNNASLLFKACEFKVETPEDSGPNDEDNYNKKFKITLKSTTYVTLSTFSLNGAHFRYESGDVHDSIVQSSTLMPFSSYKIYAHFVDDHNIISNGIYLKTIDTDCNDTDTDKLVLEYANSSVSNKYKALFLSAINVGNLVVEGFNYSKYSENDVAKYHILHSIEIDAMLYNINNNITIVKALSGGGSQVITTTAKYYTSGHAIPEIAFGNCGFVAWTDDLSVDYSNDKLYIIIERTVSNENNNQLIKISPYLPLNAGWTTIEDGFYGSYFCLIKKPSFDLSSGCYVSGNDIYKIDRTNGLILEEFEQYVQQQDTNIVYLRSNFNLNYISLVEDIPDKIFSVGQASSGVKQVAKVINSATLSFIYELKSMYKDFMNKTFRAVETLYRTQFDNTIRVSDVLSDETFNNTIFKFSAEDYYNIPTDRGIIVNLFSISNNIFVHTKNALYKFDGNATISASNTDIQLQESEPFDNGITQIFDSEYGYGGIETKQSGCITFDSYFFYDKSSNHIFAYSGNAQTQLIDGNIYKLLDYYKPKDCKTLHDEANCRILFEFTSGRSEHNNATYKTFTLSFNYKTKSFVSLHDLSLVKAFASRHKAYSYRSSFIRLFDTTSLINTSVLTEAMNVNKIFGNATTACMIEFGTSIYNKQASPFEIAIVIIPQNKLKETLDSVKYIADIQESKVKVEGGIIGGITYDVLFNPQVTKTNPVTNFYVITDSCVSSNVNTNVNDNARPNPLLDYKGFKYDMGFWTSNYFRNNINKENIYSYPQKYPNRDLDADNNSLVYGRYFIFVFDFKDNTPIKFEEIFMNADKY